MTRSVELGEHSGLTSASLGGGGRALAVKHSRYKQGNSYKKHCVTLSPVKAVQGRARVFLTTGSKGTTVPWRKTDSLRGEVR